jgi:hypothetical protein
MRIFILVASVAMLCNLNGCTVVGMAVDNKVDKHEEKHRPIMEQGKDRKAGTVATEAGLEADIGLFKALKAKLTPAKKEPRLVCSYDNNLRVCYYEDAAQ